MLGNQNNLRAREIVKVLLSAFENKEAVFSDTKELLENQIPPNVSYNSKNHANFLFYLISQDHGIKSSRLYDRAKRLYEAFPEKFDPKSIVEEHKSPDNSELLDFIKLLGVRYANNSTKYWYKNSEMLFDQYDGDTRNIFNGVDGPEVSKRIRSFYGFGPKISGLLVRVFVGTGIANVDKIEEIDFPPDIHDTRIAALTKIADIPEEITENNYSPFVKIAQNTWKEACKDKRINWLQVDRALWILGSKGCTSNRHYDCPLKKYCVKGVKSCELF